MMTYTIFDKFGEFVMFYEGPSDGLELNLTDGRTHIVGVYHDHYIDAGVLKLKPAKPSEFHFWSMVEKKWVANLDNAKSEIWRKIQDERTRRMAGGYPVVFNSKTYWLHSDAASLSQQQGLVQMAQITAMRGGDMNAEIAKWKTMTGEFISMTGNFAMAMFAAGMAQQGAIFQQAEAHKAKMLASIEPWNYDFSKGWEKIYGE